MSPHPNPCIVLHGGAGNLARYVGTTRLDEAEQFLSQLIDATYDSLLKGASATDVALMAVRAMEECGYFHAGRGSSPTTNGIIELDASFMDGATMAAGAVASVTVPRSAIDAAYAVMTQTEHVLLVGPEADAQIKAFGLETVAQSWFTPCDVIGAAWDVHAAPDPPMGTVGAVVLDARSNLVAATSTGGTLRKTAGRVGDTPIPGAGTYARNNLVAVSCTGHGEYFVRAVAAHSVAARMELLGETVGTATGTVLGTIVDMGGSGGIIAVDSRGAFAMPYSTSGMYRAARNARQRLVATL
jgi:L-asparaginase / beta-aspartyl-peptidase